MTMDPIHLKNKPVIMFDILIMQFEKLLQDQCFEINGRLRNEKIRYYDPFICSHLII